MPNNGVIDAGNPTPWPSQLYPFVKSTGVFACPDDSTNGTKMSYGINFQLYPQGSPPPAGVALAQFDAPSTTIALYEDKKNMAGDPTLPNNPIADTSDWTYDVKNRHDQAITSQANYLLIDGHVKYLKLSAVSGGNGGPPGAGPTGISPKDASANNVVATFKYN